MSSFSGLSTAYSGLVAARAALETTAQNLSNANTPGYTRQRVDQATTVQNPLASYSVASQVGTGVTITGISRISDAVVNARVNTTAADSGNWSASSSAVSTVEASLGEPSTTGLSAQLQTFWNAWSSMSNATGSDATASAAGVLIGAGQDVAATLATGYSAAAAGWSDTRTALATNVSTLNSTASTVAALNGQIRSAAAAGANVNALLDQRDAAVTSLASLAGATTRTNGDGTVDVLVGGQTLVSGSTARTVTVAASSATDVAKAADSPVTLVWSGTSSAVSFSSGTMAAQLTTLAGANATGTGGVFAEAAKTYDTIASTIADQVNGVTTTGQSSTGVQHPAFFSYTAGSAATTLAVVPTDASGIATASTTATGGVVNGTVADAVSQLGAKAGSPDKLWTAYVAQVGTQSAAASSRSTAATTSATAATTAQTSTSGVDLDEETSNLVVYQHAYQAAARVISTISDILDTLIQMGAS